LEHLEQLGDLEGVAREEASIAPFVAEGGTIIVPADAPELLNAVRGAKAQRIIVGRRDTSDTADFILSDVVETISGSTFSINHRGSFKLPLLGEHNAMNALMAIAVARRLGCSDTQIAAGLAKVAPAEGRLQPLRIGGWQIINDSYNANPSSMEAALRTFHRLKREPVAPAPLIGRKVVILGDMLELGASSEPMHRSVGAMVGAWNFSLFIAVGPMMRFAADVAETAGVHVVRFADTAKAAASLLDHIELGDELLLKGSRGMALEALLSTLTEHSPAPSGRS
jgi:UDP-N-acetylmuramoyl-tripeptide--D-alanyl-D-alanine ligase